MRELISSLCVFVTKFRLLTMPVCLEEVSLKGEQLWYDLTNCSVATVGLACRMQSTVFSLPPAAAHSKLPFLFVLVHIYYVPHLLMLAAF